MNQNTSSKIAVVGAGAVGSVLGGLLARTGEDAILIARKAHVEAINRNGLFIDGVLSAFTINMKAAERLTFKPDLVLLTVKTQDVKEACQAIKPYVKGIPIITLQNGVRSDEIVASIFGREHVISGIVCFNARFVQPGRVSYGPEGMLLVGEPFFENKERVKETRALFHKAIKTKVCNNIHGAHWTKLFMNILGNSLEAMTGLSLYECMKRAGLQKIGILLLKEALRVVEHAEIRLAGLPELPAWLLKSVIKSPLFVASGILGLMLGSKRYEGIITSTLQSMRRGKPTEIDYLNGEIVELGKKTGFATPYNSKVVELVHEIEKTCKFYSPDDLESLFFSL